MSLTKKQIRAELATFTTNRNALRDHAHKIAMMIFYHAAPKAVSDDCDGTGDCSLASELVRAMPNSWGDQMIAWFKAFSPIRIKISDSGDKAEFDPAYKDMSPTDKPNEWDVESANTTPFYEVKKEERPSQEYDLEALLKMVTRLSGQIDKKIKDGLVKPNDVESAKALSRAISAFNVERVKPVADNQDQQDQQVEPEVLAA